MLLTRQEDKWNDHRDDLAGRRSKKEDFTFPAWEAAFCAFADRPGRPIVVLDEFTYLIGGNKAMQKT